MVVMESLDRPFRHFSFDDSGIVPESSGWVDFAGQPSDRPLP